jgi:hypothetical protein
VGYYDREKKMYVCYPDEVATMREWLTKRGGLAIWECLDLSDAGKTWTTPALSKDGKPTEKPHWAAGKVIETITDIDKVIVTVPKEVKRFHVAVRLGAQGFKVKLTDASGRKVRAAEEKAGPEAWHEFDYENQDAIILVPGEKVPLKDWKSPAKAAPKSEKK